MSVTDHGPLPKVLPLPDVPAPKPPAVERAEKRRRIAEIGYEMAQLNHERSVLKSELAASAARRSHFAMDDDAPHGRCGRCGDALLPEEVENVNPETRGMCVTCVPRDLHVPPPGPELDPLDMATALLIDLD
jgi:hypothetical protein